MGFRAAADVPDTFYVADPSPNYPANLHPYSGVAFDGTRRDVSAGDLIRAVGRRTPGDTVAQRRFRFAFVLVTAAGAQPPAADVARVDAYRQQFEAFFGAAASGNSSADTTLRRAMKLSLFPWAGIPQGATGSATLTLQTPPAAPLTVSLSAPAGHLGLPPSVEIPAGGFSASFAVDGLAPGVEEVQAVPSDPAYETAPARVQVAGESQLQLVQVPSPSPSQAAPLAISVRLTDANNLAYPRVRILAAPSADGAVVPADSLTGADGVAAFQWNPGPAPTSQLRFQVEGMPSVTLTVMAGDGVPSIASVVNAASQQPGISPGALGTVLGTHLAGSRVLLNGQPLSLFAAGGAAIGFYVPLDFPAGPATLTVESPSGAQAAAPVTVAVTAPGIFPGGVLHNGVSAASAPVRAGDALEIYCTGLGPVAAAGAFETTVIAPVVFVGAIPVTPFYSGLAPGFTGVYQVNVVAPAGLAPGPQQVQISSNLAHSNPAPIAVQ
jgi:uncharacterized protein (TIGR03437 family)